MIQSRTRMREPCAARSPGVRCGLPQDGSTVIGEVAGAVDRDGTTRRIAVLDDRYTTSALSCSCGRARLYAQRVHDFDHRLETSPTPSSHQRGRSRTKTENGFTVHCKSARSPPTEHTHSTLHHTTLLKDVVRNVCPSPQLLMPAAPRRASFRQSLSLKRTPSSTSAERGVSPSSLFSIATIHKVRCTACPPPHPFMI